MTPNEIRYLRARLNVTQYQLAILIGCHPSTVYRWEAGRSTPKSQLVLRRIAKLDRMPTQIPEAFLKAFN